MSRSKPQKSAARKLLKKPKGKLIPIDLASTNHPEWITRVYKNNRYIVMIDDNARIKGVAAIKAMVQRHDDKPIPGHWRELQDIKNEILEVKQWRLNSTRLNQSSPTWQIFTGSGLFSLTFSLRFNKMDTQSQLFPKWK